MIALNAGDKIQGDAETVEKVDFSVYGKVRDNPIQMADGQLDDSIGDLYTAPDKAEISAVILTNTNSSAEQVNLYLLPLSGTARRLIPEDLSLGIGYTMYFDGTDAKVINTEGRELDVVALGTIVADIDMDDTYQLINLAAPVGADEAVRSTAKITEAALETVLDNTSGTNTGDEIVATGAEVNTGTNVVKYVSPEAIGDSKLSLTDGTETLTNKTVTAPVVTNPSNTFTVSPHDYSGGAADWTLSGAELLLQVHKPTNANGAVNAIIADTAGVIYVFVNGTGQALTVKGTGTGIVITNGKTALVMSDGTNVIALATESA